MGRLEHANRKIPNQAMKLLDLQPLSTRVSRERKSVRYKDKMEVCIAAVTVGKEKNLSKSFIDPRQVLS